MVAATRFRVELPRPPSAPFRQSAGEKALEFSGLLLVGLSLAWSGICLGSGLAAGWMGGVAAWEWLF